MLAFRNPRTLLFALLCLCLLLSACSGAAGTNGNAPQSASGDSPDAEAEGRFAGLPSPSELLRNASAPPSDSERYRSGNTYGDGSTPNRVVGVQYSPNWQPGKPISEAAWAFYNFTNMTEYNGSKRIRCIWDGSAPAEGNLYVALGDFTRDRWVWFAADANGDVELESFAPYLGQNGRMLAAVLLTGSSNHNLEHILLGDSITPFLSIATDLDPNPLLNTGPREVNIDCSNSTSIGSPIMAYDFDWQGDGIYEEIGNTTGITSFTYQPGTYSLTIRLITEEGLEVTGFRDFVIIDPSNQPPVAGIGVSASSGDAPLDVNFNPGLSSDSDGSIIKYEWDFNNDAVYEMSTTLPEVQNYVFGLQGTHTIGLRITDNDLAVDTHSVQVSVTSGWQTYTVDSGVAIIDPLSACVAGLDNNAKPCVAFGESVDDKMIVKVGSANGQSWTARILVGDSLERKGHSPSLTYSIATDSLMLAFGQYDSGNSNNYSQYFARSTDAAGTNWNFPVLVSGSSTDAGSASSLFVVNNLPCIAAVIEPESLAGNSRLVYFQANDNNGASWQTPVEIMGAGAGRRYGYPSLGVQGCGLFRRPLVAFRFEDGGPEVLAISLATGIDGNAWNPPSIPGSLFFDCTDMEIVQDRPSVVTGSLGSHVSLGYIRADGSDGAAWSNEIAAPTRGSSVSLIVYDNKPAISFCSNEGLSRLCLIQSGDINGNTWAKPMVIDNTGYPAKSSMVNCNGVPMILYYKGTGGIINCAVWD